MSNPITDNYDKLISKITPDVFSYVKLFADTDKPEYFLVNTIISDLWLDELKIFNETSLELPTEKYLNRSIINYVTADMSNGFKILYSQILTGDIPIFNSVDEQLEYLLILNRMTTKEKIEILVENLTFDYLLWERIINLNINFKDFLPEFCKVIACHYCLCNMKGDENNIINFFGLKTISDYNVGNKYFKQFQNYKKSSDIFRNKIGEFKIFDNINKISYHVIGVGPLNDARSVDSIYHFRILCVTEDQIFDIWSRNAYVPLLCPNNNDHIICNTYLLKSHSRHYVLFNPEPFDCYPGDIICDKFDDYYSFDFVDEIDIFQDNKMKIIKICEINDDSGGC